MNNVNELDSQMCNKSAAGCPPDLLTNHSINIKTQVRLVTLVVLAVFFGEVLVMFILPLLPSIPMWGQAFVDAALLIIFVSPALYFGLFRSLIQQLEEHQKNSRELEKHRGHLEELIAERTTGLSAANEMLTKEVEEREATENELWLKTHQLGERVKELNCLYSISGLLVSPNLTLETILQRVVTLIPAGWQFPDITCAKIKIENQEFKTANYKETKWQQAGDININGERLGDIVIGYRQEKPKLDEGPFSKEERNLITAIAEQLEKAILQKKTEDNLRVALGESRMRQTEVSALLEGARSILKNREFKAAARSIFDHCKDLVGATAGYVALINREGNENEVLFLDSGGRPCSVDPLIPMPIRGLRAEAYTQAQPVYTNEFRDSQWNALLPQGHVDLANVLFAPLIIDGQPAGVIGLANKPGGFDENDVQLATAFGELAAIALLNSRSLESLQNSEERFRSVVATATEGIIVVDSKGEIQFWNASAESIFGYSAAEVNGRNLDFVIPKRFQQAHQSSLKKIVTTGESKLSGKILNMTGIRKDGTEFPLELTLSVWKAYEELFFTSTIRDVTARKRAEEALKKLNLELEERVKKRTSELSKEIAERKLAEHEIRESKAKLQAVFDGISDPLILVDKEMRIKMMNQMAVEYYNKSDHKDSIGKKCHQAAGKPQVCRDCLIPAVALKGQYTSFERQGFINPDSIEQVVVYPVKERAGDTGDAIIRISDITEAKQLERRLIQSEKMASLGVLVSSIAHEINNPNNFVSFNIPILREYTAEIIPYLDRYAAEQPDFELCNMPYAEFRQDILKLINNIENGSRRISTFVSNLRQYSQGGSIKAFSWLDLAVLIDKVLAIIQTEINKTVKIFKKSICVKFPEIYSDGLAIEQILINLLMNAAQAVEGGNSRVELNVVPSDDLLESLVIEISDNGCGMDDDTQLEIFNPFFTTKSAGGGTGLGLYVCHNLVKGLGGRLEVESEVGKGSTFRLTLPGTQTDRSEIGEIP